MIKITERDMKKWFPANRRFLHFCAKYYGLSFFSDIVVEEAEYQAMLNVMRLYNREQEFDDDKHLYGTIMSCFKFGILSAYAAQERKSVLDSRCESEMVYTTSKGETNYFDSLLVSLDKPYDTTYNLIYDCIEQDMTPIEAGAIRMVYLEQKSLQEAATEMECKYNTIKLALLRGLTKLRKVFNAEQEREKNAHESTEAKARRNDKRRDDRVANESVPKPVQHKRPRIIKADERTYSKALSFIHT